MVKPNQRFSAAETRVYSRQPETADANSKCPQQLVSRPRSLTMGESVILDFLMGEEEATLIVESWQPRFKVTWVDSIEALEA